MIEIVLSVYLAGLAIGLMVMRDPWTVRLGTAALWPLGLVTFGIVVVLLLFAAIYLWPVPVLTAIAVAAALWLAF
jgi:hypothetical protein